MPRRLTEVSDVQALIDAVKAGDSGQVQALIAADPTLVNAHADGGESAVLLATYYGHRDIADLLVLRGANLTVFEASAVGQVARVEALLAQDPALVNAFSPDGFTPLGLAAFFGHAGRGGLSVSPGRTGECAFAQWA